MRNIAFCIRPPEVFSRLLPLVLVLGAWPTVGLADPAAPGPPEAGDARDVTAASLIQNLLALPAFSYTGVVEITDSQGQTRTIVSAHIELVPTDRAARWEIAQEGGPSEQGVQLQNQTLRGRGDSGEGELIWETSEGEAIGPEAWAEGLKRELAGADLSQAIAAKDESVVRFVPSGQPNLIPGSLAEEPLGGELVFDPGSGLPIRATLEYRTPEGEVARQTEEFRALSASAAQDIELLERATREKYVKQGRIRAEMEDAALRLAHQIRDLLGRPDVLERKCSAQLGRRADLVQAAVVGVASNVIASAERGKGAPMEKLRQVCAWVEANWGEDPDDRDCARGEWVDGSYLAVAPIVRDGELAGFVCMMGPSSRL